MSTGYDDKRTFYMVRHAECEDNAKGVIPSKDTSLSPTGVEQGRALEPLFSALFHDTTKCYFRCSALPRAQKTAELMSPNFPPQIDADLSELDSGVLTGLPISKARAIIQERESIATKTPSDVDPENDHTKRVVGSVIFDHRQKCPEDQTPVFLSHYVSIKQVARALGIDVEDLEERREGTAFKNGAMYCFEYDKKHGHWQLSEMFLLNGKPEKDFLAFSTLGEGKLRPFHVMVTKEGGASLVRA